MLFFLLKKNLDLYATACHIPINGTVLARFRSGKRSHQRAQASLISGRIAYVIFFIIVVQKGKSMTPVDLKKWPRRAIFELYRDHDYPQINVCTQIDVTATVRYLKAQKLSKFKTILWTICYVSNTIDEFKYRIRNRDVVLHDVVRPSFTTLTPDNLFAFCGVEFTENIREFFKRVDKGIEATRANPSLEDEPGKDDLLYISCLPWLWFTSISHPVKLDAEDSIPRISWGKIIEEGAKAVMPLSVQVHHGLADGYHLALFFDRIQQFLNAPAEMFAGGDG
jgi:chloramphenicol O-acetyltransferase type A